MYPSLEKGSEESLLFPEELEVTKLLAPVDGASDSEEPIMVDNTGEIK